MFTFNFVALKAFTAHPCMWISFQLSRPPQQLPSVLLWHYLSCGVGGGTHAHTSSKSWVNFLEAFPFASHCEKCDNNATNTNFALIYLTNKHKHTTLVLARPWMLILWRRREKENAFRLSSFVWDFRYVIVILLLRRNQLSFFLYRNAKKMNSK